MPGSPSAVEFIVPGLKDLEPVIDIMAALKKSLKESARKRRESIVKDLGYKRTPVAGQTQAQTTEGEKVS